MYVANIRLELALRMNGMYRTQFDHMCLDLLSLSDGVLTIDHVKLMQSTAFEQKRFDLRSLSPALSNLWLLRVTRKYHWK